MKKIFAALLLSVIVVSTFTACSSNDGNSKVDEIKQALGSTSSVSSKDEDSKTESSSDSSTDVSSKSSSNKAYATIKEFVNSDDGKKVQESTQESAGSDITFTLADDGNNLVYIFKYNDYIEFDIDSVREYLDSYDSIYTQAAEYVESVVDVENPHIILRYTNIDDTLLYEIEYDASGVVNEIVGDIETSDDSSSSSTTTSTSISKYSSIAEYIASDEGQNIIETTQSAAGSTMKFELLAESNNKFVYQYTYMVDTNGIDSSYFSNSIKNYEDTYSSVASALKTVVDVEKPVVVIRYLASDGSNIYTAEFDESGLVNEIK